MVTNIDALIGHLLKQLIFDVIAIVFNYLDHNLLEWVYFLKFSFVIMNDVSFVLWI